MPYTPNDPQMPQDPAGALPEDREEEAGRFGMWLFLASLSVLFLASLVGFVVTRGSLRWHAIALPGGLWLSTALLFACDVAIYAAQRAVRGGRLPAVRQALVAALVLGTAFLVCQTFGWAQLAYAVQEGHPAALAASIFYLLTGLHGLHVIGGLVPLSVAAWRGWRGEYTARRHAGLTCCAMYWHYLGVVWLVIFIALQVGFWSGGRGQGRDSDFNTQPPAPSTQTSSLPVSPLAFPRRCPIMGGRLGFLPRSGP